MARKGYKNLYINFKTNDCMKNSFTLGMLLVLCMSAMQLNATYFVVGNGADDPNQNWCHKKNWVVDAAENALDENGSITFTNVAGGKNYGFKITDGQWDGEHEFTTIDYENCDAPMYGGDGSDIGFTLSEDADVTITFVNNKVQLRATKPLAYRSNYYYLAGNGDSSNRGDWCNGASWNAKNDGAQLVNDQIAFTALPAQWYEFKVTNGSWDKTWGYSALNVESSSPMHKTYGEGNNICFRLQAPADVTIKMVNGQVVLMIDRAYCITGNGEDAPNDKWLKGKNWEPMDEDAKLDANYSRTFANLPAGTYKFKVKEYADGWNDDCTWGYDHLDTENSIECTADGSNIAFTLTSPKNVTIAIVNNKIRVTAENVTPTAMDNVTFRNDGKYYDILGREVSHPQPGNLYIHNGKKILF